MTEIRVLAPTEMFAALSERFIRAGWQLDDLAVTPIRQGEPEHATFGRAADRVFYSFNPVCDLRVVDLASVSPAVLPDLPDLPVVGAGTVVGWLADADERTLLRGILAAGQLADPALADAVRAHVGHPRRSIAEIAARVSVGLLTRDVVPSASERQELDAAVAVVVDQLQPLLAALAGNAGSDIVRRLRPTDEDHSRAFLPAAVETAVGYYRRLWTARRAVVQPATSRSLVQIHVAPAGMLGQRNYLSRHFPGGYASIAQLLTPTRVWVAWKYLEPGASAGMSYDGLVWCDDHWAWFPQPYRALADLVGG